MITIPRLVLDGIKSFASDAHPREIILLLRGNSSNGSYEITEYLIPPHSFNTKRSAGFRPSSLPIDFSIIGTVHSHPSGNLNQSVRDKHSSYGRVNMLVGPPYAQDNVTAYTRKGERIPVRIID